VFYSRADGAPQHQPRRRRDAALAAKLVDIGGGWVLSLDCRSPGCRRDRRYSLQGLAGVLPAGTTLSAAIRAMRCRDCGARALDARLVWQDDTVPLTGRGVY
jgi:hypothetical protein